MRKIAKILDSVEEKVEPVCVSFLNDLKESIELTDVKNRRTPSLTYKPSSMACVRSMFYQVTGAPCKEESSGYSLIGICNSGTDIHVRVQQAVEDMKTNGFDCEYIDVAEFVKNRELGYLEIKERNASGTETKLYHKELNISFMCDGIIKYKNHYYILEIKTENSYKWTTRKDVDPKHYDQGTAYSAMFNLPEVLFVYVNRDVLDMKSYIFKPTDEQKNALLEKIHTCETCRIANVLPEKPKCASSRFCAYCAYKKLCDEDKLC